MGVGGSLQPPPARPGKALSRWRLAAASVWLLQGRSGAELCCDPEDVVGGNLTVAGTETFFFFFTSALHCGISVFVISPELCPLAFGGQSFVRSAQSRGQRGAAISSLCLCYPPMRVH